jgi:hypothetical protein
MNSLQIVFNTRAVVRDKRYRVLVTLIRSDRPRYWRFKCFNDECPAYIVDIQNMEVVGVDDFYDPQNVNNTGIGHHCKGTLPNGLPCQYSYFFHVQ